VLKTALRVKKPLGIESGTVVEARTVLSGAPELSTPMTWTM
jgi:hypothetical protein